MGVELSLGVDGTRLLERARTLVKSPGVPRDARWSRRPGSAAPSHRRARARLADDPESLRSHRDERKDHDDRAARAPLPERRPPGRGRRERRDAARHPGRRGRSRRRPWSAKCSSFQLEDCSLFAPECAAFISLAPDHLDRHGTLDAYLEAKLRIFANQGNDDVAVYSGDTAELRGGDLGGYARRVRFCPAEGEAADPDCELGLADGVIFAADEPLVRADELQLIGAHNIENAMAAAAAALASSLLREAVADGLRASPASRTGSSGSASWAASSTSTTRRRPTSRRRWPALGPSSAAFT